MVRRFLCRVVPLVCLAALSRPLPAAEPAAAERGRRALLERNFNALIWSARAYDNAWRQWRGRTNEKPEPYAQVFMERYGLHPAPFQSDYPMGIRQAPGLLLNGLTTDCLLCHGGSIAGQSYVGLGNSSLDIQALYSELAAADGRSPQTPS